jgi:hypothetical protein
MFYQQPKFISLNSPKLNTMNTLTIAKIKKFFPKHTMPCVKNFILLMNCILQCRTVCLYKCRDKALQRDKKRKSMNNAYAKLIRFFKMHHIGNFILGIRSLILTISEIDLQYLIVDRSNWKRGIKNFNLLTIGSLIENVFMPLHWLQLNKRGNSNIEDRKSLIEGLCDLIDKAGRTITGSILLADREFIGQQWFEYLLGKNLSFVIRLREKMYFELQTVTGKKNFIKIVLQRNRTLWNICYTNETGQCNLHFRND